MGAWRCFNARVGVPGYVWNCAGRRDLGRRQVNTPLTSVPQLHACLRTYIGFRFSCPSHAVRIIDAALLLFPSPLSALPISFFASRVSAIFAKISYHQLNHLFFEFWRKEINPKSYFSPSLEKFLSSNGIAAHTCDLERCQFC